MVDSVIEQVHSEDTGVGISPNDWVIVPIGKFARLINGRAYALHEWETQGIPVIRLQNLTGRGENFYYSNLQLPEKQYCKSGDLLFMWSATFGPVIWKGEKAIYHYHIWKIETDPEYLDKGLLYHLLNDLTERVKQSSTNGGTMLHLTKSSMESMLILIPPTLVEQTAIATTLNDADALITQLEKLIAKKRAIKHGAMQELLKPKEGWEVKKLGEITFAVSSGKSDTQSGGGIYAIYGSTGIIGWTNKYEYEGKKILIARVGANAGTVNIVNGRYCVSDNTLMISLKPLVDINFIFYTLIACDLNSMVFGSGQPLITGGQLKNLEIGFPQKEIQTQIAQTLSDMDAEIEALEKKLAKYQLLKQGMMQSLLTGKIRLV